MNKAGDAALLLERRRAKTLEALERVNRALIGFRYEGKPSFGKNISQTKKVFKLFNSELRAHLRIEDKVLFPFAESHLPKLELLIRLLRAEHDDLKKRVSYFSSLFKKVPAGNSAHEYSGWVRRVSDTGTYAAHLLKHHLKVRSKGIDRVVLRELRPDEKRELGDRIRKLMPGRL